MSTRRSVIASAIACAMLAPGLARAEDQLDQAAAFIRQSGNELATLAASAHGPAGRAELGAFVQRVADVDSIGRFCLGRYWRVATPAQQQAFLGAFAQVLVNSVAGRLGGYQGGTAHVIISRPVQAPDGVDVTTTVERPGNPTVHVTWVVSFATGSPRIVDVIAEGMSMRLTQRSDYASYLTRNNNSVDALIQALQKQAASG